MAKSLGSIELIGSRFLISAPAHVALRLKRVFERISKGEFGTLTLSATPENGRELSWFLVRYPMDVDAPARAKLDELARVHEAREAQVALMLSEDYEAPEFELAVPAREYQKKAAALALATGRLLLADDVGLGKTASAIATFTDPRTLPAVVVTLTHLPNQWAAEIKRFAPNLRVHVVERGKAYDLTFVRERKGGRKVRAKFPDVVVLNYAKLHGWAETLGQVAKSVVFDEVQELRKCENGQGIPTKKYAAAKFLADAAHYRMGLSATPIYNFGGEFFNVFEIIAPDALGTRAEWGREWCTGVADTASVKDPEAFGSYLREQGLMLRRTRVEVGRELPPLTKSVQQIDCNMEALNAVGAKAAELARIILTQGGYEKGEKLKASEELSWRLRQATGVAKAPFTAAFVRMLVESGEKVLLYGWHHEVYAIWKGQLKDLPWMNPAWPEHIRALGPRPMQPVFFTGNESTTQKEKAKLDFINGNTPVLVMSLRAGAGVDGLQGSCRTVVYGEIDWSPGVHEQGIGRIHRDGQKEPVIAYFLLSDEGSDPVVADVLGLKKAQIDGVRDPGAEIVERQVGAGHVKRLARAYLEQRGLPVPKQVESEEEDNFEREPPRVLEPSREQIVAATEPTPSAVEAAIETIQTIQQELF